MLKYRRHLWKTPIFLILLLGVQLAKSADAKLAFVVAPTTGGIQLYSVSEAGDLILAAILPSNIAIEDYGEAEWMLYSHAAIKVAPNGLYLAFDAVQQTSGEIGLFIYDINQSLLTQKTLPSDANVFWSPGSDAILLAGSELAVYDLATDQFTSISSDYVVDAIWLPDNQRIVYVGDGIPCDSPCRARDDLYIVNRDGTDLNALTNLGSQLAANISHTICQPTWSDWNERIYFRVGCNAEWPNLEYLYSTDITGNNRLEIEPTDLNRGRDNFNIINLSIDNSQSVIYATIVEQNFTALYWRIIQIDANQQQHEIFESLRDLSTISPNFLIASSLSPDGLHIALSSQAAGHPGTGLLWVIDSLNGQTTAFYPDLESICQLSWSDDNTVIFTQEPEGKGNCLSLSPPPKSLWEFDLVTSNFSNLTTNIDAPTFPITIPVYSTEHQ